MVNFDIFFIPAIGSVSVVGDLTSVYLYVMYVFVSELLSTYIYKKSVYENGNDRKSILYTIGTGVTISVI